MYILALDWPSFTLKSSFTDVRNNLNFNFFANSSTSTLYDMNIRIMNQFSVQLLRSHIVYSMSLTHPCNQRERHTQTHTQVHWHAQKDTDTRVRTLTQTHTNKHHRHNTHIDRHSTHTCTQSHTERHIYTKTDTYIHTQHTQAQTHTDIRQTHRKSN